jgi:putative transposase
LARLARLTIAGLPHHVIQLGHNRQAVFVDDADRRRYLEFLRDAALDSSVGIHAYVLLPERVHLVATPKKEDALSRMMQRLGRRYVGAFNQRHVRLGTLWEGRFRCSVLEPARYLLECMTEIELKPVRHGLVAEAAAFSWSSAAHHCGVRHDPIIVEHPLFWALGNTPFEREAAYLTIMQRVLTREEDPAIDGATLKGWALGSKLFVDRHTDLTGRRLTPLPRGRPPKRATQA